MTRHGDTYGIRTLANHDERCVLVGDGLGRFLKCLRLLSEGCETVGKLSGSDSSASQRLGHGNAAEGGDRGNE